MFSFSIFLFFLYFWRNLGQRANAPVGQLILLVSLHPAKLVEQKGEGLLGIVEHARRLARVEHVHHKQPKVALQPLNVKIRPVKHL